MSHHYREDPPGVFTLLLPTSVELEPYRNFWVAVDDGLVVGSGKALKTALKRAHAKSYDDPLVFQAATLLPHRHRHFYYAN